MSEPCETCAALREVIAAKDAVIEYLQAQLRVSEPIPRGTAPMTGPSDRWRTLQPMNDPTAGCPCRVENGGSGVCNCIRGSGTICSVGVS